MKLKRAHLYLREYPRLIRELNHLINLAPAYPNVALVALFGSVARLEPRAISDTDLLVLVHDPRSVFGTGQRDQVVALLVDAQQSPWAEWCTWGFSAVDGNAQASDLDEDFVSIVGQDGVLLYLQEGAALPPALKGLQPYDRWLERVEQLLARCRRVVEAQAAKAAS